MGWTLYDGGEDEANKAQTGAMVRCDRVLRIGVRCSF